MKTLDRQRPFGQVCPPHNGVWFEQDGLQFDREGKQVGGAAPAAAPAPKRKPADPAQAPLAGPGQLAAQLEE